MSDPQISRGNIREKYSTFTELINSILECKGKSWRRIRFDGNNKKITGYKRVKLCMDRGHKHIYTGYMLTFI